MILLFYTLKVLIISGISKSETINLMQNINFAKKKENIIKYKKLLSHTKMGKEIFMFGDIETEKNKFYHYKNPIFYQI